MHTEGIESDGKRLMGRLKDRDTDAMAELYDGYGRIAYRVILQMVGDHATAEDLTQETFLRIWNGARGFDEMRGSVKTWIVAVARNCAIDFLRSVQYRMVRESVDLECANFVTSSLRLGMQILALDASPVLSQAMAGLTANERRVLNLCYCEGMTHSEIARRLDQPLGTVKTWIRKAVRSMRERMQSPSV